jgi:hypothetical protein
MNCCICGTVKNCGSYLKKVLENMEKIGSIFDDYQIIIYYDKSNDNTLDILKEYQETNLKFLFYINKNPISKFRTHNIAIGRNLCLNYVTQNIEKFPYFIMMDCDDVNCKELNLEPLKKNLMREDWDGLTFNTSGGYYDIWALSIKPYYFSYLHFKQTRFFNHNVLKNYINSIMNNLPKEKLLECLSAFNGFAIYKTNKFLDTYYDGRIRLDLIPKNFINIQSNITKSKIIYKKYEIVDGRYEDCEHRAFHIQAIKNSGARIRISSEILFY